MAVNEGNMYLTMVNEDLVKKFGEGVAEIRPRQPTPEDRHKYSVNLHFFEDLPVAEVINVIEYINSMYSFEFDLTPLYNKLSQN